MRHCYKQTLRSQKNRKYSNQLIPYYLTYFLPQMAQCFQGGEANTFGWEDYAVIGAVMGITCVIGSYYAFSRQQSDSDFLTAEGSMPTLPTALSIATGFVTAIELLGNPAEMYINGTQYGMIILSIILVIPITAYLYLPVFMKLRLTSCYEYLELRFDGALRYLASSLYIVQMVFYTSVAVYAPALALSHVTGLNTYIGVAVVYLVCMFYASLGGMKAVIMTDTFQTIVLLLSLVLVMIIGDIFVGGPSTVFQTVTTNGHLEFFNFNPNPTERHTFWSVAVGGTFYWATMFCSNQASVQKYNAVRTLQQARHALGITCIGLILIFGINFYTGLMVYATFVGCDPLKREVEDQDELVPYYVMRVLGHLRGLLGLYVAGILAASLGTVAATLNSLAAVFKEDILTGLLRQKIPTCKGALVSQALSLIFGLISFGIVFVVANLGAVLQLALTFNGLAGGVVLGLFSLGMFVPWANSKGALFGAILGFGVISWIGFKAQGVELDAQHRAQQWDSRLSNATSLDLTFDLPSFIYKISYLWYSAVGFSVTFVSGILISIGTGAQKPCLLHQDLISPPILCLLNLIPENLRSRLNLPSVQAKMSQSPMSNRPSSDESDKGIRNEGIVRDDE